MSPRKNWTFRLSLLVLVKCSECQKTSETFDPLLDVSLDIKTCGNLKQALNRFTKPDALDGENQYACPL